MENELTPEGYRALALQEAIARHNPDCPLSTILDEAKQMAEFINGQDVTRKIVDSVKA